MSLGEQLARTKRRADAPLKKSQVQVQLVLPVLAELGWNSSDSTQLDVERRIDLAGTSGIVDIVLRGKRGEIIAHINLANRGDDLVHLVEHTLRLASTGTVRFAVATDGVIWILYLRDTETEQAPVLVARVDLSSISIDRATEVLASILGRRTMIEGHAAVNALKLVESRRSQQLRQDVPRVLADLITEADELLVQLVHDRIQEESNWSPSLADVAEVMKRWRRDDEGGRAEPSQLPTSTEHTVLASDPSQQSRARRRYTSTWEGALPPVVSFSLLGYEQAVHSYAELMAEVAGVVYLQHRADFDHVQELRGSVRTYYSYSNAGMVNPKRIPGSRYYVETNFSSRAIIEQCHKLLTLFGHSEDDLEVFFD